jgi:anti-sigma-K factor RskA
VEEIKAYIESGVLELYVLGDMSVEEKAEVEAMASKHAEVKAELEDIERSMQMYADAYAIEPADELRDRVLNSLVTNLADDRNLPDSKVQQRHQHLVDNVVPLHQAKPTVSSFYKYGFAASVLLLCLSLGALTVVYNQLHSANGQLSDLRIALQQQNQKFTNEVSLKNDELSVYRDPSFKLIQLKGTPKSPASALTIAWSPKRKKVMIDMKDVKLPATDKDHQYQLWVIANGKPVDLGVFDGSEAESADMKLMKSTETAQAFAVTIEPRGGSVNPTMDQMVVMASL